MLLAPPRRFATPVVFVLLGLLPLYADPATVKPAPPRAPWTGGFPGPTLADDLDLPAPSLVTGYTEARPRLLFSAGDRAALQKKARENPTLWETVLANARRAIPPESVPTPQAVTDGKAYWRVEFAESAALAWFVTGEEPYKEGAIRWLVAHCKQPVWGTGFRPNLDLQASWYLYHLAIAYDILAPVMTEADRAVVRAGLAAHAMAIFADFDPAAKKEPVRYDQNHTYIPTIALLAASLALSGEEPEASAWLKRAQAVLRRCRYVLGDDGYYFEGFGYWCYAFHWHVRGAELLERATGAKMFDLPAIRENWRFALHLGLPGFPGAFDVGDTANWHGTEDRRPEIRVNNSAMLWRIATANGSRESRTAGDLYGARLPERDYPSAAFLWFDPSVPAQDLKTVAPYQYFKDHDVVTWRSDWSPGTTAYLFRCGPPLGHAAAAKQGRLKDWEMNAGHVHPDIGAFYMFAKGAYLAVGTGYTAEKWTRDHNTLLVDGKGQAVDGNYHNEHGVPYAQLDAARLDRVHLEDAYGYASGEFGNAYTRQVKGVNLRRSLLMTKRWLLILDEMKAAGAHTLTWLCHADAAFLPEASAGGQKSFVARLPKAALAVVPLATSPGAAEAKMEDSIVMAGMAPNRGTLAKHGSQLALTAAAPEGSARFVNLLVPLGDGEKLPTVENFHDDLAGGAVSFALRWPDGTTETVRLNTRWTQDKDGRSGPAAITTDAHPPHPSGHN